MKNSIFLLFSFLLATTSYSQSREEDETSPTKVETPIYTPSKHRIGVNIGGSKALGLYSEVDPTNSGSGYAEGGVSLGLSYQYRIEENIAITLLYGSSANRFNAQAFADQLSIQEPSYSWLVEAQPYGVGYFMFGVKGYVGDAVKVYVNPIFGFGTMHTPLIDVTAHNGSGYVNQKVRESDSNISTLFGVGFGVDFNVSKLVSINLDATYLKSEFEIEQYMETYDSNGNPILLFNKYNQPFSVININVGIGFNF